MIRDLGQAGFRVLTAEDGADAVEIYARQFNDIDLVVAVRITLAVTPQPT